MFPAENLRDWRGHKVIGSDGGKIGALEAIYVDTRSDEPSFASVKVGGLGRVRLIFVPLEGATVAPDHVKVAVDRKLAKSAPAISTDGELMADAEPDVFGHYGIAYSPGPSGERLLARR